MTVPLTASGPIHPAGLATPAAFLINWGDGTPIERVDLGTGVVFVDTDGDAVLDQDEPGLAGVTIYVDLNNNDTLDADEPTALSGPDGSYTIVFQDLEAGSYTLRQVADAALTTTFPTGGEHTVSFDGTSLTDQFNFGNQVTGAFTPAALRPNLFVDHVYPDDGEFTISVVAIENDSVGGVIVPAEPTASVAGPDGVFTVTVVNLDPSLSVSGIPAAPIDEGREVNLVLNHSDVGDDSLVNWNIDWGDGTVEKVRITRTTVTAIEVASATFTSPGHGLADGNTIQIDSTGSLPNGLSAGETYMIDAAQPNSFKLKRMDDSDVTVSGTGDGTLTFSRTDFKHTYRDGDDSHQITIAGTDEDGTFVIAYAKTTFTADAATSTFTSTAHGLSNDDLVQVTSTVSLPSALSENTPYYVVSVTDTTPDSFQLSETMGGSPIELSTDPADAGTGEFFFTETGFVVVKNVAPEITLTGDIQRPVHFDLVSSLNADVVVNRRADSTDATQDGSSPRLLTATAATAAGNQNDGLPDDGLIPAGTADVPFDVQLNYNNALDRVNVVHLSGQDPKVIQLREPERARYEFVRIFANAESLDGLEVVLTFADDSTSTASLVSVPGILNQESFSVNVDDDKLLTSRVPRDGDSVRLVSTGSLPQPLSATTTYFVVNAASGEFQVSDTLGGAAIELTNEGSGSHSFMLERDALISGVAVDDSDEGGSIFALRFQADDFERFEEY